MAGDVLRQRFREVTVGVVKIKRENVSGSNNVCR